MIQMGRLSPVKFVWTKGEPSVEVPLRGGSQMQYYLHERKISLSLQPDLHSFVVAFSLFFFI